jgi:hypothetical protein
MTAEALPHADAPQSPRQAKGKSTCERAVGKGMRLWRHSWPLPWS